MHSSDGSDVGHVLLDVLLELGAAGPVGGEEDAALQRDEDLGLGGGVEVGQVEGLDLLLVDEDDVDALFELVDDAHLQVAVEGHEGLAGTAPGGVHVDDEQLGVALVEVGEEVLAVADGGRQLHLLHYLRGHQFKLYINTNHITHPSPLLLLMDDIQRLYRDKINHILHSRASPRVKCLLMAGLCAEMRQAEEGWGCEQGRGKGCEVLSTAFSECPSNIEQTEKDIEQLQQRILQLQRVKFEKNEHIQALEEELEQAEQAVRARSEYNDHLKRKMVQRMEEIQREPKGERQRERSVLNKSIDAVAGILTFRWW